MHTHAENGKLTYAFLDLMQYPHDSNLVIEVIMRVLREIKEKDSILPEVLYLQLDNCYKENKNRFILAFCSLSVIKKVFKKVL